MISYTQSQRPRVAEIEYYQQVINHYSNKMNLPESVVERIVGDVSNSVIFNLKSEERG